MVMQIQRKDQVLAIAKAQSEGRLNELLARDKGLQGLQVKNAAVCQRALFEN